MIFDVLEIRNVSATAALIKEITWNICSVTFTPDACAVYVLDFFSHTVVKKIRVNG